MKKNVSVTMMLGMVMTGVVFFTSFKSFAQNFGVTVYQNTDLFQTSVVDDTYGFYGDRHLNAHRFSVAFSIKTAHKITHELELFVPEISKDEDKILLPGSYVLHEPLETNKASAYSMRYTLTKKLTKGSGPFSFNLGAGINPFLIKTESSPTVAISYPNTSKTYGVSVNVTPELQYMIAEHFRVAVSIPFKVFTFMRSDITRDDPSIPIRDQDYSTNSTFVFEDAFTMRLGMTYLF